MASEKLKRKQGFFVETELYMIVSKLLYKYDNN